MKLDITRHKPNTQTVQFRIDPDTNRMLTKLRSYYGVSNGVLIKQMIRQSYESVFAKTGEPKDWRENV